MVVALAALGLVLPATPAFAHAQLLATEPVGGAAGEAPDRVLLRFSESVEIPVAGIRVFNEDAELVTAEKARHPEGKSDEMTLPLPDLDQGAYVVTWRATSADSHPVHGAFTFRVGPVPASADTEALARRLLAAQGGDTAVGAAYAGVRFAAYGSLLLLAGSLVFLTVIWPAGAGVRRARRLIGSSFAILAGVTAVGIPLQALYANCFGFSDLSSVTGEALDGRFGRVWAARLVLLGVLGVMLVAGRRATTLDPRSVPPAVLAAGGLVVGGLLMTPGLSGHASTRDLVPLALASDLVHLAAVSVWLGGLVCLLACVLPRRDAAEMASVVPRFSLLAGGAVAAIVVTGVFQSWREVGSVDGLTSTTYGRLLVAKLVIFGALVALGWFSRRWVHARYRVGEAAGSIREQAVRLSPGPGAAAFDSDAEMVTRLRRSVGVETVLAVAVLAVTALLVAAEPARSALSRPFTASMSTDELIVELIVDPAKAGPVDFHFYTLSPEGAAVDVEELGANLRLPSADIGPLPLELDRLAPGHYASARSEVPLRGEWELEVVARLSEFDQVRARTTVPVR